MNNSTFYMTKNAIFSNIAVFYVIFSCCRITARPFFKIYSFKFKKSVEFFSDLCYTVKSKLFRDGFTYYDVS